MSLFRRRSDLPLEGDATSRFLPWMVAPMVFLSALALAGGFILQGLSNRWDRDVTGTLTVEVGATPGDSGDFGEPSQARVERVLQLLQNTPGISDARALSQAQLIALMSPWLGSSEVLKDLPLPALIDVTVKPEARLDIEALGRKISEVVPGASLDDHRRWLARLLGLSRDIEGLAFATVTLIGLVTAATVHYATRTGMEIHREVIEVLHLIGAPDAYIANQFAHRAGVLGLKGGLLGLVLTLPVLIVIGVTAHRLEGGILTELSLPLAALPAVAALPVAAAALAMLTARAAAYGVLARLL